jgi:D-glycero-alpha-D-manno-heptose-7-phosphate kinase
VIISQTPLRMSFAGGGSDLPAYYRKFGGAVLSTAINKYVYVTVNRKFDDWIRVSYSKTEEVRQVDDIEHKLVRESLRKLSIDGGIEITSVADIPSRGTGLGSSSSFTVGLIHSLHAYKQRYVSAEHLAAESCEIEIDICGERIGKQDQYAAAYGGLNFIRFNPDDSVVVEPIICGREVVRQLERSIIVFYTGLTRSASSILEQQSQGMEADAAKQRIMQRMVDLACTLRDELQANHLDAFGEILHENWVLKKQMNGGISSEQIDCWYDGARAAGALGGKMLGAGAGGFLMFYAPPERHEAIARTLSPLRQVRFGFEPRGSRIILFHPSE